MKKIGILTITDFNNYGNRLQCYALQKFIENMGFEANQINFKKINLKKSIKSCLKCLINYKNQRCLTKRKKMFKAFTKKYIKTFSCNRMKKNRFDTFIVGSDQVWNPYFDTTQLNNFLIFTNKQKRNSYAASFGISEIPYACKDKYAYLLREFNHISVREDTGADIIKELTGKEDVEVLLDPTMLIKEAEWASIAKKPIFMNDDKYILLYFLGKISDERKKIINEYAKKKNLKIINILDKSSEYYITGPSEFLYLEKNAEAIFTDSFHSTVFALIFNRPFLVFNREDSHANMNSRVETLLTKFKLIDKKFKGKLDNNIVNNNYNIDEVLNTEIEKSKKFIKKIVG